VKKEIPPVVVWVILGVIVLIVAGVGYRLFGPRNVEMDKTGSEESIKQFQETGTFYTPPPGVVPGAPGGGMAPPGGGMAPPGGAAGR
jgi:hypothetical protein